MTERNSSRSSTEKPQDWIREGSAAETRNDQITVTRYGTTRFWAVYERGALLCVTVYKKGALAVEQRINREGRNP